MPRPAAPRLTSVHDPRSCHDLLADRLPLPEHAGLPTRQKEQIACPLGPRRYPRSHPLCANPRPTLSAPASAEHAELCPCPAVSPGLALVSPPQNGSSGPRTQTRGVKPVNTGSRHELFRASGPFFLIFQRCLIVPSRHESWERRRSGSTHGRVSVLARMLCRHATQRATACPARVRSSHLELGGVGADDDSDILAGHYRSRLCDRRPMMTAMPRTPQR